MQIKAPDLGVDEAEVSEILVKVGDKVEKEQSLLVLESAKASVEVPSPASGTIKSIVIKTGQNVTQGDVLFELEDADDVSNSGHTSNSGEPDNVKKNADGSDDEIDSDESERENDGSEIAQSESDSSQQSQTTVSHDQAKTQASVQDVQVPDLGVDEAEVSEILVKIGDVVEKDQSLLVLDSAKASVEVPSPFAGKIKEIKLSSGQKVSQGALILTIEVSATAENSDSSKTDSSKASSGNSGAQPSKPQQENSQQAKPKQAKPKQSTSETTQADQQRSSGQADDNVDDQAGENTAQSQNPSLSSAEINANAKVHAGPAVRQLARQLGVALANVEATGANQRIVKEDVFAFVKKSIGSGQSNQVGQRDVASVNGLPKLPDFEKFGGSTIQPMTRLQQVSVPQLSLNNFIPQVTQFDLADITELENWRNEIKADYKKQEISLTILAFIVKALAHLLKQEPYFNSHLADDQKSVVLRNEIHIGIAVATEDGLTVPVLRNPDTLSIKEIAVQLGELSQKARDKKLKPQELQGASFTITSLGSIGGTAFTPLVNWPQVAILGISPASMQPVWNGKKFKPLLMLPLSLSYDHRVINGADAARFSRLLTALLADIRRVLL